ncbi:hypothetical protein B0T14DRAFT_564486 [Immersiella caudata]|uniref:YDG domain-containing protein n=1 Tax=Immersiella caudata TaxID=314043 RepID=A0AA40C2X8_9PEZI|nr:hypothetical protein B0T14DRAFT_564486 [Immersiella caudata]
MVSLCANPGIEHNARTSSYPNDSEDDDELITRPEMFTPSSRAHPKFSNRSWHLVPSSVSVQRGSIRSAPPQTTSQGSSMESDDRIPSGNNVNMEHLEREWEKTLYSGYPGSDRGSVYRRSIGIVRSLPRKAMGALRKARSSWPQAESCDEEGTKCKRKNAKGYEAGESESKKEFKLFRAGSLTRALEKESTVSEASSAMDPAISSEKLLELSDSVRESIKLTGRFANSDKLGQELLLFLETALSEEDRGVPTITYDTIKIAHLDHLLKDIDHHAAKTGIHSAKTLERVKLASILLRKWQIRFGVHWFELDKRRTLDMMSNGGLRDVSFTPTPTTEKTPAQHTWKFGETAQTGDIEGNSQFRVGQWWLNIACAHRDGIVGSEMEKPTKGRYENSALPLLSGKEELVGDGETVHYTRVGGPGDMHVGLMNQLGRPIRVLRGFKLMSSYAPSAGVRYDGLWKLTSYRHHVDDAKQSHLRITLEHVRGQTAMAELKKIPRPSQTDDFRSYQQLETEMVVRTEGKQAAHEWGVQNEEDRRERDRWARYREFRSSIGAGPMRPLSGADTGFVISSEPLTFEEAVPKRSNMALKLPPAIQTKATKAEREERLKREGIVKKTVIDTSLNQEHQLKSRDSGQFDSNETRGRRL